MKLKQLLNTSVTSKIVRTESIKTSWNRDDVIKIVDDISMELFPEMENRPSERRKWINTWVKKNLK